MYRHAVSRVSLLTSSALRTTRQSSIRAPGLSVGARSLHISPIQRDAAASAPPSGSPSSEHALSNPKLANIEKRFEHMSPQEQAELWMALRDRMTSDWHHLTHQEKRAAYWMAFGPHGPRKRHLPTGEAWLSFKWTVGIVAVSCVLFAIIRAFARDPPKTMTKEWQEMTNEYLKKQGSEAITGVAWEGYQGPGMVQSKPGLDKYKTEDDE